MPIAFKDCLLSDRKATQFLALIRQVAQHGFGNYGAEKDQDIKKQLKAMPKDYFKDITGTELGPVLTAWKRDLYDTKAVGNDLKKIFWRLGLSLDEVVGICDYFREKTISAFHDIFNKVHKHNNGSLFDDVDTRELQV